jgi:glycosyltransferase involved in cell wall biosynthesis
MAVYAGENSDFLRQSMESIFSQTLPTDDFVLVCDGLLTSSLDETIDYFVREYPSVLKIVRMPKNQGLAAALNVGLNRCVHDIIAGMDSDDIALPEQMARQLAQMEGFDIVGGAVLEFSHSPKDAKTLRTTPAKHESIVKFARCSNPFNHPCVMYRKSAVLRAGGYEKFPLCEDY